MNPTVNERHTFHKPPKLALFRILPHQIWLTKRLQNSVFMMHRWLVLGFGLSTILGGQIQAENFSLDDPFLAKLSVPTTSILDGRHFVDAIDRLTTTRGINVWIGRHVDPSTTVQQGQLGPNVYAAVSKVAQTNDCVVMPLENVLVIGPAHWVEELAELAWRSPKSEDRIDLHWERLTTPSEALSRVTGEMEQLPHDLWPAKNLNAVRKSLAEVLIRGQFLTEDALNVKPKQKSLAHRYRGLSGQWVRDELQAADPKSRVKKRRGDLWISASAGGHRAVLHQWLISAKPKQTAKQATFSLKTKVQAGAVMTQLAKAAGWTCTIEASALPACQREIQVEVEDKTLPELLQLVCEQAGVSWERREKEIVISQKVTNE